MFHLNASQAMCINFFYPLIEKGVAGKTNFDFYMKLGFEVNIYFEIKYTETSFGNAKHDSKYKNKFYSTYYPLLKTFLLIQLMLLLKH